MDIVIKPKKTSLFDAKPVIKYAAQQAVKTGKVRYVFVKGANFVSGVKPPEPRWSHWKVDHMAELYAHIGGLEVTEYNYEKVGADHGAQP